MPNVFSRQTFWVKIAIVCVMLALIFNFFSIGIGFLFSMLIGGFVDIILFVVLDVFVAAILFGVDILLWAIDIFLILLFGAINIVSYALLAAIIIIPLALFIKYNHRNNDAEYK